jgi:hypothetical protein
MIMTTMGPVLHFENTATRTALRTTALRWLAAQVPGNAPVGSRHIVHTAGGPGTVHMEVVATVTDPGPFDVSLSVRLNVHHETIMTTLKRMAEVATTKRMTIDMGTDPQGTAHTLTARVTSDGAGRTYVTHRAHVLATGVVELRVYRVTYTGGWLPFLSEVHNFTNVSEVHNRAVSRLGVRVESGTHTDAWMRGDRYGNVVKVGRTYVHVSMDRSGRTLRFRPENLALV